MMKADDYRLESGTECKNSDVIAFFACDACSSASIQMCITNLKARRVLLKTYWQRLQSFSGSGIARVKILWSMALCKLSSQVLDIAEAEQMGTKWDVDMEALSWQCHLAQHLWMVVTHGRKIYII